MGTPMPSDTAVPAVPALDLAKQGGLVMSVPPRVAEKVSTTIVPEFSDKLTNLFEFYCTMGSRTSDTSTMSVSCFTRLMQDSGVVDTVVTFSAIDVQVWHRC